jgi:hypothetical protein
MLCKMKEQRTPRTMDDKQRKNNRIIASVALAGSSVFCASLILGSELPVHGIISLILIIIVSVEIGKSMKR